jgi:hypothetical protein
MKKYTIAIVFMAILSVQLLNVNRVQAQTVTTKTDLTKFVGKYQFTNNKMTFLQIMLKDNNLVLKQLWDNREITFKQTGDIEFYNDESSFPLKFTKDNTGKITQVLAFDRDLWNRVPDDYQPKMEKIITLSASQLNSLTGKYERKGGDGDADDRLQLSVKDGKLVLTQMWDKAEITLYAISEVDFYNENQTFPIKFTKGSDGLATQLLAKGEDVWLKVK